MNAKSIPSIAIVFFFVLICATCCSKDDRSEHYDTPSERSMHDRMVLIPEGPFIMGSVDPDARQDERPKREVYIRAFYIDIYEVTNEHYQAFIQSTGHPPPHVDAAWAEPYNWTEATYPKGKAGYPVVLVSWYDAAAYAAWAGKRLPTEAEWEKAARGGLVSQKYPFGHSLSFKQASFFKDYLRGKKLYPVGRHEPNPFGLYDIAGNVWEWCQDWYSEDYYALGPHQNPQGPDVGLYRVYRGGSWINEKKFLRCSVRGKNVPEYKSATVGFRCAVSAQ